MNYPPPQQQPSDDAMIRAMKRPNRAPLFVALAAVVAVVGGAGLWTIRGFAATRAELVEKGYTDPKVKLHGPFTFGFSGKKGDSVCSGTVTRYPGSTSTEESCFDTTPPAPPPPPPLTNREQIERSLRKNYAKLGFDKFTCPEIADSDAQTKCTVAGGNGVSVTVSVERTKTGERGEWAAWTSALDATVGKGEDLSKDVTESVTKGTAKKHHVGIEADCGKGPVLFVDGKLTCDLTTQDKKPVHTKVVLTLQKGGGYKWSVTGL
jgi:hypothetical protein